MGEQLGGKTKDWRDESDSLIYSPWWSLSVTPGTGTQGPMNKGSYEKKRHSWRYDSMARGRPLTTRNMCETKMHYIYRAGNRNRSNSLS